MSSQHSKKYSMADESYNSVMKLFCEKKWDEAFEFIQAHEEVATMVDDGIGKTALHEACFKGAPLRIIDELIRINPAASKAKSLCGLPLHRLALSQADPAVVRRVLQANPSAAKVQANHDNLPLHCASGNDDIPAESFEVLLAAYPEGAYVANNAGELPLHTACDYLLKHDNLCRILSLLMKANPAAVSTPHNGGHYPFHVIMQEIVHELNPESLRGFSIVLDATSGIASTPCSFYNGGLPLHYLLDSPPSTENFSELWTQLVASLIKAHSGALTFADNDGLVPLHIAVKNWPYDENLLFDEEGEFLDNPPAVEELSEFHCQLIETLIKANPSAASIPDNEGHQALHLACMYWPSNRTNRLTVLLAANKTALDHVDNNGKTPLQYAFERNSDAEEFVTGLVSVIQEVEQQQFANTNMAIEGLSVGLAGARKGLDELREKIRSLEEENAQLKAENAQLRS